MSENFFQRGIAFIKAHPWSIAGGILVLGVGYIILNNASSGGTPALDGATATSDTAAGNQLAAMQLQSQTQIATAGIQADTINQQTGAQVAIAQLAAAVQTNNTNVQGQAAEEIAGLQAQTTQVVSALQATVAGKQVDAQVQEDQIQADAYTAIANAPYNAQIAINTNNNATSVELSHDETARVTSAQNQVNNIVGGATSQTGVWQTLLRSLGFTGQFNGAGNTWAQQNYGVSYGNLSAAIPVLKQALTAKLATV